MGTLGNFTVFSFKPYTVLYGYSPSWNNASYIASSSMLQDVHRAGVAALLVLSVGDSYGHLHARACREGHHQYPSASSTRWAGHVAAVLLKIHKGFTQNKYNIHVYI